MDSKAKSYNLIKGQVVGGSNPLAPTKNKGLAPTRKPFFLQFRTVAGKGMIFRSFVIKFLMVSSVFNLTLGCPQMEMPGESYSGKFKALDRDESAIRQNLEKHIAYLAGTLGERNMFRPNN